MGGKRRFSHQLPFTEFMLSNFQLIHTFYHKKVQKKKRKVTRLQHPLKSGQRTTSYEESLLWLTSQGLTLVPLNRQPQQCHRDTNIWIYFKKYIKKVFKSTLCRITLVSTHKWPSLQPYQTNPYHCLCCSSWRLSDSFSRSEYVNN